MDFIREPIDVVTIHEKEDTEGVVIINISNTDEIGLGISLRHDGDTEIWMSIEDCEKIITALKRSIEAINQRK